MFIFFFQAEDGIRDKLVTGVQTCALPIWPLRRSQLARISSSRHAVHRRIRLPGSGEKPFFPLCSNRSTGPTHPENSARVPAPRFVAFAPSGIIRTPSLHSGSSSPDFCSNGFLAVHFVASVVYDTVVLEEKK